jgi:hypothetical protein
VEFETYCTGKHVIPWYSFFLGNLIINDTRNFWFLRSLNIHVDLDSVSKKLNPVHNFTPILYAQF